MYQTGFKFKFIRDKFENNRALYDIDIFPISLEKPYSRIKFLIDKTKMQIFSVEYYGKDGNTYTIEINKLQSDLPMEDNIFTFDKAKFPKVEVVDMR